MTRRAVVGLVGGAATAAAIWLQFGWTAAWDEPAESLADLLDGWARHPLIPGVLLHVTRHGEVAFDGASGFTTLIPRRALRPTDRFHTASIGKLFTAVAALRLWERGQLDIDVPAAEYVGGSVLSGLVVVDGVDFGSHVTARQLLNHTSGLANTDSSLRFQLPLLLQPRQSRSPELLLRRARHLRPVGRPGQRQNYASPGYVLLGLVLQAVTGRPYHEVIRQEVLSPLDMSATVEANREWVRGPDELHHYAGLYDLWEADPSFEFADGGFVTTGADLTRFGRALMEGTVFAEPTTLQDMRRKPLTTDHVADSDYIGLGLNVADDGHGRRLLYHHGFWGSGLVMRPDADLVLAYSCGQSNAAIDAFQDAALTLACSGGRSERR